MKNRLINIWKNFLQLKENCIKTEIDFNNLYLKNISVMNLSK
jgi:hypothetical protein